MSYNKETKMYEGYIYILFQIAFVLIKFILDKQYEILKLGGMSIWTKLWI